MNPRKIDTDKLEQIAVMRKAGLTYAKIGLEIGVSKERVRQILARLASERPRLIEQTALIQRVMSLKFLISMSIR